MRPNTNKKTVALNLLIAIVISVVVNFSYFVFIMVENSHNRQAEEQPKTEVVAEQNAQNSQSGVVKNANCSKKRD